ncbi:MAG: hypothetical protein QOH11_1666 [Solirubrobacteraceae bacterium]|nr:hypothetical protein [Solirubrobacteraceae bacterium]
MKLVFSAFRMGAVGGSETYVLTVAEHLQALGHEVTVHATEMGEAAGLARDRGLRVVEDGELPENCDGVLVQDGVHACLMAERYPAAPRVFVAHTIHVNIQRPPQVPDVVNAVVVLNDRIGQRFAGMAREPELVRLRQPLDLVRFSPRGRLNTRPKTALLLGNYLRGDQRDMIVRACAERGIATTEVGAHGTVSHHPEVAICEADVVLGYGRAVLEAMSCGRAAYVIGDSGGDGWVTASSYAALEADGFGGSATPAIIDGARLARDLGDYEVEMGAVNRHTVSATHGAFAHAADLVALLRRLEPRPPAEGPLAEVERLTRLEWATEARALLMRLENEALRDQLQEERASIEDERGRIREHWNAVESFKGSRRYRLAQLLGKPLDRLRRREP